MRWHDITRTVPCNCSAPMMVWRDGWRFPALAAFDPDTGEFFDPVTCLTHPDPTHWIDLPTPPR